MFLFTLKGIIRAYLINIPMPYRRLKYGFLLILIFNLLNRKTKWVSCIAVDLKAEIYCNKEGVHKLRSAFRADRLIVVVSKCKH